MMLHAALQWPSVADQTLWPLALSHAAYLHNQTLTPESGLSPMEIWSWSKSDHHDLWTVHPWGCPAYVLDPKLCEGSKIPKWAPCSCHGQYMGHSAIHASSVGLVRHLQTGHILPQFHMVYDDYFETVHSDESDQPPPEWADLVTFNSTKVEWDDPDFTPELHDEWLTPEELHD